MVKVTKMSKVLAEKAIAEAPTRKVGHWTEILADLVKTGQGAKITELTRGQVAALIRQAKVEGFYAVAVDKYSAVVLSPPTKKGKKKDMQAPAEVTPAPTKEQPPEA